MSSGNRRVERVAGARAMATFVTKMAG